MAKQKPTKNKRRRTRRVRQRSMTNESPEAAFAELLANPCDAIPRSFYPGETGIVNRFVQDFTINGIATHTSGIIVYNPGGGQVQTSSGPSSNVAQTPTSNPGPGGNFIGSTANKIRALAGCVTIIPSAVSMTNMTGEIAVGIVSADSIVNIATVPNAAFSLCQKRAVLSKTQYDIKWFPGALDHTYNTVSNTGTSLDQNFSDSNSILVVYRGYPPGVELSVRVTGVLEWTPRTAYTSSGLTSSSASNMPVDVGKVVGTMAHVAPNWWHNLGTELARDAGMAAKYVGRQLLGVGATNFLSYANRVGPKVLSGLGASALLAL